MDMKKFLQAVDGNVSKPEVNSSDMSKFLSIVEGKDYKTNRLSMAEQMAVQHYQEQSHTSINTQVLNVPKDANPSMIGKYFKAVEQEIAEAEERTQQESRSRAKQLAERVLGTMYKGHHHTINRHLKQSHGMATSVEQRAKQSAQRMLQREAADEIDTVTMDIPLLLRIMEYAKEDAKTDMDLHNVTEKLIAFAKENDVLTMDLYNAIVGEQEALPAPGETTDTEE